MLPKILRFLQSEDGPTSVEYAVMLAMIIGAIIGAIGTVGSITGDSFGHSRDEIIRTFPKL